MSENMTISLPPALGKQAADLAAARGETIETVIREAIAQYAGVLAFEEPLPTPQPASRTELGARLRKLRAQALATEASVLDWEDLYRELAERRGERDDAASDLR